MSFHVHPNKTHFHVNGFAPGLIALDNKARFNLRPSLTENLISLAKIIICYHLRGKTISGIKIVQLINMIINLH